MSNSAWMALVLHLPIVIPCILERVLIYFNVYMKLGGTWRSMRLFSWKEKKKIFSNVAASVWFAICFRLNSFTSKISNLLLSLAAEMAEGREYWYTKSEILNKCKDLQSIPCLQTYSLGLFSRIVWFRRIFVHW